VAENKYGVKRETRYRHDRLHNKRRRLTV